VQGIVISAPGLNSFAGAARSALSKRWARTCRRRRIWSGAKAIRAGVRPSPCCRNRGCRRHAWRFGLGAPGFSPDLVVFEERWVVFEELGVSAPWPWVCPVPRSALLATMAGEREVSRQ
jgi:hypothetical protein